MRRMRSDKERTCLPSVKVRLAPLPTRNLNFGNSLNLEECLNRSVAMDRPSSRISELSNYSGNSMISVSRSNYEQQSENLRRSMNRNVIEALRMKDLRRKRNYLNENADNYSVDLAFNSKRKRAYEDDEDSELDCLFNRPSREQGMKFARRGAHSMHIPTKNRFISSQFKNNEIASSYFSINQTISSVSNNNSSKQSTSTNQAPANRFTALKRTSPFQANNLSDTKNAIFQVPVITISNSSSKDNANVSINLSNASISPINKKAIDASVSPSDSYRSVNSSSSSVEAVTPENMSFEEIVDQAQSSPIKNLDNTNAMTKVKEKNHSPTYKIPEHFHSIDEHIRDEKKAKSRLGNFLKAIYNATTPFISMSSGAQENDVTTTTQNNSVLINQDTITTTTTSTKTSDDTKFKLPSTSDSKLNTSTPLKVNFNIPDSSKKSSTNSSFAFKFGGEQSTKAGDQQTSKSTATRPTDASSTIFNFGASLADKPKDTEKFALPSTSNLSTALSTNSKSTTMPNFSFGSTDASKKQDSTSKTSLAINLPSTSNFNPNAASSTVSLQDANKSNSSSFGFKFGEINASNNLNASTNVPTVAPVFSFGSSASTTNNSLKPSTNTSSSIFSFGQTADKQQSNSTLTNKPSSGAFAFGNLNKSSSSFSANNSTFSTSNTFKASSSNAAFNFGASSNQNPMSQNSMSQNPMLQNPMSQNSMSQNPMSQNSMSQNPMSQNPMSQNPMLQNASIASKPNFSFGGSTEPSKLNEPLSSGKSLTSNTNVGFNFNLNANLNSNNMNSNFGSNLTSPSNLNSSTLNSTKPPAFNFSTQQVSTSTPFKEPFKFDANQAKPSFNFGSSTNQPPSFNFSATQTIPQFGSNPNNETFTAPAFNSTSKNMFTVGRK